MSSAPSCACSGYTSATVECPTPPSRLRAGALKGADDVYFPNDTVGDFSRMKYGDSGEVEVGRLSLVDGTLY